MSLRRKWVGGKEAAAGKSAGTVKAEEEEEAASEEVVMVVLEEAAPLDIVKKPCGDAPTDRSRAPQGPAVEVQKKILCTGSPGFR